MSGHLMILPILIPLVAGAVMLLYDDRQRRAKMVISLLSALALLACAVQLLVLSKGSEATGGNRIGLYLLGNWPSPFGIVLVLDRLSALMLLVTAVLALASLVYAAAGWHRRGQHYHSLFQFLLMGVNGAFLTGDLFNLFVFFEVMLAASYGLLLHGSGPQRVGAGLHYIAINLAASLLLLIGISLIYGVTGTLNMADLAVKLPMVAAADRPLLHMAAAMLGVAFLVKAGMWPLSFWLANAYMAAAAPVAAMFAIMTKVGIYVILRLTSLLFTGSHASTGFGSEVLLVGGVATIIFGFVGVLAAQGLGRMAGHLVLVSSGTMLAVIGMALGGAGPGLVAGALYYMVSSTLALAALFLLLEPMGREQGSIAAMLALTADAFGIDDEGPELGLAIPATLTVLGLCFAACTLLLAGMPPLAGFVGKFAMLSSALNPANIAFRNDVTPAAWVFTGVLLLSGLATLVALVRVGVQTFWANEDDVPKVMALEIAPVIGLLALTVLLTVEAQPVIRYMDNTARALNRPEIYTNGVLQAARQREALQ
ncbi:monovalent cation/H+ antiporter subunit D [Cereibacter changlensis]|uniref:Monovalent cation/H+ antiporter subunit D n=1 Tax=Cereibacter changlensis TaxID=402884 RepID=A0A4U0YXI6_9RHOB|nr:monovalent cation/H+ antiporter subunit D [Cereibacter changlensis]TKA94794.1 monovalent cation/H+ antiporter subunit D [Cereibacter changlensis]